MKEKKEHIHGLATGAQAMGLLLTEQQVRSLEIYCRELLKWNRKVNLVARHSSEDQVLENHFLDSLTLLSLIQERQEKDRQALSLLDIGTGAGFPGLVLAAALPGLQVRLVEPRQKRVMFLQHVVRTLGLENVQIYKDRVEDIPALQDMVHHYITSRAVAEPGIFLPMIRFLCTPATQVILMMARKAKQGDSSYPGFTKRDEKNLTLPFSQAKRCLQVLEKQRS